MQHNPHPQLGCKIDPAQSRQMFRLGGKQFTIGFIPNPQADPPGA